MLIRTLGLYGIYFPKTPSSIGSATIGLNLGFLIGCSLSLFMCMRLKTYIYIGIVITTLVSFITLEVRKNLTREDEMVLVQPNINDKPVYKIRA